MDTQTKRRTTTDIQSVQWHIGKLQKLRINKPLSTGESGTYYMFYSINKKDHEEGSASNRYARAGTTNFSGRSPITVRRIVISWVKDFH